MVITTRTENKSSDKGRNRDLPRNSTVVGTIIAIAAAAPATVTVYTKMSI